MSKYAALMAEAKGILAAYKDGTASEDQKSRLATINNEMEAAKQELDQVKTGQDLLSALNSSVGGGQEHVPGREPEAKSLGEAFIAKAGDLSTLARRAKSGGFAAPEFKAATDAHTLEGLVFETVTQTVVEQVRPNATVANLLSTLPMSNPLISYFREVADSQEGAPGITAEGAEKPYVRYKFEQVQEGLAKIAGLTDTTTEMAEDAPFLVSLINSYLVRDLVLAEEAQILRGDGVGNNLLGLENISGVLDITGETEDTAADRIRRALTAILLASKRNADGLLIHPKDWEDLQLAKDANGQYYAGGPFFAPYGQGQLQFAGQIWGLSVVATPNATLGKPMVGAFKDASLLRKGGITVAASDQHDRNFSQNKVTFRAEERVGLMVPRPGAFAKVTLAGAPVGP